MTTATVTTAIPTGTWAVDPAHSTVGFQVKHMGIATVRGAFNSFEGYLDAGADGSVQAYGKIDAASVDTNEPQRDAHLRSPDFFDAEQFPVLEFRSTAIEIAGEDELRVTGDLSLHGVTRSVSLDVEVTGTDVDPWGNERVALEARGELKRSDYGMRFNQMLGSGNALVSDKVKLLLDISAVKQS